MNIESTIRKATAAQANIDARPLPRPSTVREKSLNERDAEYHPQGYYLHFCHHDKTLYEVCSACHRTKRDAQRNLSML